MLRSQIPQVQLFSNISFSCKLWFTNLYWMVLYKHGWADSAGWTEIGKTSSLISDYLHSYLGVWWKQQYYGEVLGSKENVLSSQLSPNVSSLSNVWHLIPNDVISRCPSPKNLSQLCDYENRWWPMFNWVVQIVRAIGISRKKQ